MYVCMYVCMHTYEYVVLILCMYVCMFICMLRVCICKKCPVRNTCAALTFSEMMLYFSFQRCERLEMIYFVAVKELFGRGIHSSYIILALLSFFLFWYVFMYVCMYICKLYY